MADVIEYHKMKMRRGSPHQWRNDDIELLEGELGLEYDSDTDRFAMKVGWGTRRYSQLKYAMLPPSMLKLPTIAVGDHGRIPRYRYLFGNAYGDAGEGDYTCSGTEVLNEYACITSDLPPSSQWVPIYGAAPASFIAGAVVMVHQSQNYRWHSDVSAKLLDQIGVYELNVISEVRTGWIRLAIPLTYAYLSDGVAGADTSDRTVAQIISVPQFNTLTVSGTLTCDAWDGSKGGILAFMARAVNGAGSISTVAKGYRGGEVAALDTPIWSEGWSGWPTATYPMTTPHLLGSATAYRSGFGYDDVGGSGIDQGTSVLGSGYTINLPEAYEIDSTDILFRALMGCGAAIGQSGQSTENGAGAIVAYSQNWTGFSGQITSAGIKGGAGTILLQSEASFSGFIDYEPSGGTPLGGDANVFQQTSSIEPAAGLDAELEVVADFDADGDPQEIPSTAAVALVLNRTLQRIQVFSRQVQNIPLTAAGTFSLFTVSDNQWLSVDRILVITERISGSGELATISVVSDDTPATLLESRQLASSVESVRGIHIFDVDNDALQPGTEVSLSVDTAGTQLQHYVTVVIQGVVTVAGIDYELFADSFPGVTIDPLKWTLDTTDGAITNSSNNMLMAPTADAAGAKTITATVLPTITPEGDEFVASLGFATAAFAGSTTSLVPDRTISLELTDLVRISCRYRDYDSGKPCTYYVEWLEGSTDTDESADQADLLTGGFHIRRVDGVVTVYGLTDAGWVLVSTKSTADAFTAVVVTAEQIKLSEAWTVAVDDVVIADDPGAVEITTQPSEDAPYLNDDDMLVAAGAIFTDAEAVEIAGGVVTVSQTIHRLLGEGGAEDELNTIAGGEDGQLLILTATTVPVTINWNADNIINQTTVGSYMLVNGRSVLLYRNDGDWYYAGIAVGPAAVGAPVEVALTEFGELAVSSSHVIADESAGSVTAISVISNSGYDDGLLIALRRASDGTVLTLEPGGNINVAESTEVPFSSYLLLIYDDTTYTWSLAGGTSGGSSGGLTWSAVTTDTAAETLNGYLVDASSNTVDITLPAAPDVGDQVGVRVLDLTNAVTVAANGSNIEGAAEDLVVDIARSGFLLVYSGATYGWVIVTEVGAQAAASAGGVDSDEVRRIQMAYGA